MEGNNIYMNHIHELEILIKLIDEKIDSVIDSSNERTKKFKIGRVIESLLTSGVDFYSALEVISNIEKELYPGIETKKISTALIQQLEKIGNPCVNDFKIKYDEGVTVQLDGNKKELLRTSFVVSYVKARLEFMGVSLRGRNNLDDFSNNLSERCKKLGIPNISLTLLDELFEQELSFYLDGRTIDELEASLPSEISFVGIDLLSTYRANPINSLKLLSGINRICKAILIKFHYIPSIGFPDCLNDLVAVLQENKEPNSDLGEQLINFMMLQKNNNNSSIFQGKKYPLTFFVEKLISAFRRLSYLNNQSPNPALDKSITEFLAQDEIKTCIILASNFASFLWPEECLAASTMHHLRQEILTILYRNRCVSFVHLTRTIQVHPKHTMQAIVPLIKDKLISKQRLIDGELLIITITGEEYCEQNLDLKLRRSLSCL